MSNEPSSISKAAEPSPTTQASSAIRESVAEEEAELPAVPSTQSSSERRRGADPDGDLAAEVLGSSQRSIQKKKKKKTKKKKSSKASLSGTVASAEDESFSSAQDHTASSAHQDDVNIVAAGTATGKTVAASTLSSSSTSAGTKSTLESSTKSGIEEQKTEELDSANVQEAEVVGEDAARTPSLPPEKRQHVVADVSASDDTGKGSIHRELVASKEMADAPVPAAMMAGPNSNGEETAPGSVGAENIDNQETVIATAIAVPVSLSSSETPVRTDDAIGGNNGTSGALENQLFHADGRVFMPETTQAVATEQAADPTASAPPPQIPGSTAAAHPPQDPSVSSVDMTAKRRRRRGYMIAGIVVLLVVIIIAVAVPVALNSQSSPTGTSSPPVTAARPSPFTGECFDDSTELRSAADAYLADSSSDSNVSQRYGHPINEWCVSKVVDMDELFSAERNLAAASFNEPLNKWDVGNVRSMRRMFEKASAFNQNLSSWNVEQVQDFTDMFNGATSYAASLCSWLDKIPASSVTTNMFQSTSCPRSVEFDASDPSFCTPCDTTPIPTAAPTELKCPVEYDALFSCFRTDMPVSQIEQCTECQLAALDRVPVEATCSETQDLLCPAYFSCPCGNCNDEVLEYFNCLSFEDSGSGCSINCTLTSEPSPAPSPRPSLRPSPRPTPVPLVKSPTPTVFGSDFPSIIPTPNPLNCAPAFNNASSCSNSLSSSGGGLRFLQVDNPPDCYNCFATNLSTIDEVTCEGFESALCQLLDTCQCGRCKPHLANYTSCLLELTGSSCTVNCSV